MTIQEKDENSAKQVLKQESLNSLKVHIEEKITILEGTLGKFLFAIITIVLTATITWYVNYRLSYLDPILSITNIEFFYDLQGRKDLIEIPVSLLEIDSKGFFGRSLKHFMQLDELNNFTDMNRPIEVNKRYELFSQELEIFLRFLSERKPNYNLMSQYVLDFLRSGGFSGIAAFLVFLEEKSLVDPLIADPVEIDRLKDESGKIKVAENLYFFTDAWSKKAETANQQFMAKKIEWFAARVIYHLVENNRNELRTYLNNCKTQLTEVRKYDMEAETEILNVIEEKAKKYKKTKLMFQIVNRTDFPLLIFPHCEILFLIQGKRERIQVEGRLKEMDKNSSEATKINLFKAFIIKPKASQEFLVVSGEIPEIKLDEIKESFQAGSLQSRISVYTRRHKGKEEKYESAWIVLRER